MDKTPLEDWIVNKIGIERNREALENYQLGQLRETIKYVKERSAFYGRKLSGLSPDHISQVRDIDKIPFTYPKDIGANPYGFLCIPQRQVERIVTLNTSGTSSKAKRIFFNKEDIEAIIDFFHHGMASLTNKRDRLLVLLPGDSYGSIGNLLRKALDNHLELCMVGGLLEDRKKTIEDIKKYRINCIVGLPSQIIYLSRMEKEIFQERIDKVLLCSDYAPKTIINDLTHNYGCQVFIHYGMTETGYGGGVMCQALKGYHLREGDLYFEIVDPTTGQVLGEDQYGEIVFTTLTRQAMPLIRYRTGDIGAISLADCPCGSFLKSIKTVEGRIDNRVSIGRGRYLYLRELDEIMFSYRELLDYRTYINKEGKLVIDVIARNLEGFKANKIEIENRIQNLLLLKSGFCLSLRISIKNKDNYQHLSNSMIKRKILDFREGN